MEISGRPFSDRAASAFDVVLEIAQVAADSHPGASITTRTDNLVAEARQLLLRLAFVSFAEHRGMLDRGPRSLTALFAGLDAAASEGGAGSDAFGEMLDRCASAIASIGGAPFEPSLLDAARGHVPDRLTRALFSALLPEGPHERALADVEVEQLGGMYEALLASSAIVTREPTAVVRRRGPAAGADTPIGLGTLLRERGATRVASLRAMGVEVTTAIADRIAAATDVGALFTALDRRTAPRFPGIVPPGRLVPAPAEDRRRSGSHYTARALATEVARKTIAPLLSASSLPPRVCDPSMGSGAFLIAACAVLAESLAMERAAIATTCLYGVDRDRLAVELAKASLWLFVEDATLPLSSFDAHLVHGDALVEDASEPFALRWSEAFPEVYDGPSRGFDAFVGNPPWVSFVGRAAQPLDPRTKELFRQRYESFAGYRNLQGLFIERCASLLRPGGRLGLVVPSSMSEQAGYAPTRLAHDCLCVADPSLPDIGEEAFAGVFQPCMVLLSTRQEHPRRVEDGRWSVERRDLDEMGARLRRSSIALPARDRLRRARAPELRGGFPSPSSEPDLASRGAAPRRDRHSSLCQRCRLRTSRTAAGSGRLRDEDTWRRVKVLVRQTAAFPIAALSDGAAFRNSLLAVFDDPDHPPQMLVAYLNSTPIRWLHYARHRDARQGMPQVKVGHLRSIPRLDDARAVSELSALGRALSERNEGIDDAARRSVDEIVARALGLDEEERAFLEAFAQRVITSPRERPRSRARADAALT